ncbi:MAG: proliferating cell nuclear antigen (pcna) [Thaumarchaeota archaeon]|nr:proliferating cell nuclear antigen (pcna) [Candidatus Calditenuaceae archaeon]MDW8186482.1 proliferating cell nuclear antigen (pcna) [Nitrososphaerota archaeon]
MEVLYIRFPNADYVTDVLRAITAVIEEGTFKVTAESLRLTAMDPAHISLVDLELKKESAEEYRVSREVEITLNVNDIVKLLRRARRSEALAISYDDEVRRLRISLADVRGGKERDFVLSTLEPMGTPINPPNLTFEAWARVSSDEFYEAIEDAKSISDSVRITIRSDSLIILAKGESKSSQHKFAKGGAALHEVDAKSDISASFSIAYLEKIVRPAKQLSEEMTLHLSNNRPIKLSFPLSGGKVDYLIAPRMD